MSSAPDDVNIRISNVLRSHPRGLTITEIAKHVNMTRNIV